MAELDLDVPWPPRHTRGPHVDNDIRASRRKVRHVYVQTAPVVSEPIHLSTVSTWQRLSSNKKTLVFLVLNLTMEEENSNILLHCTALVCIFFQLRGDPDISSFDISCLEQQIYICKIQIHVYTVSNVLHLMQLYDAIE